MPRVLLIIPPFTQLNTPYPATASLTGFLRARGYDAHQRDLSIETLLRLFSRPGLTRLFDAIRRQPSPRSAPAQEMLEKEDQYLATIEAVVRFLQGRDPTLAHRICFGNLLPEGPRSAQAEDDSWAFGTLGLSDRARHRCTLVLDDLAGLIQATLVPDFGLSRYAERLAASAWSFEPLAQALERPLNLVEELLEEALLPHLERLRPDLVGLTVPFPGNLLGALRVAQLCKRIDPRIHTVLGGGYANTELRSLTEARLFDVIDFVTLDDGERPLVCLIEHLEGGRPLDHLRRTFVRIHDRVTYIDGAAEPDIPFSGVGVPTYDGLPLDRYLSVLEVLNPMHRLWSDGRWNKLTLAHGCYWRKCAFCDITLDYIGHFDSAPVTELVNRIEALVEETGQTGFHFVDEAAPPLLLRDLALELLGRRKILSWWGNIRFEKTFTPDLCRLLAASGCIAVSGGLEVASDRLLKRMAKGVSVEQVARVAQAFTHADVMVHAYLMYGFPTQTAQETVDSLERVRQLFDAGVLQSGFWHRFVATRHAPIGQNPDAFEIELELPPEGAFATNDLMHRDPLGCDHDAFAKGLDAALQAYMIGADLEEPLQSFFDFQIPASHLSGEWASRALSRKEQDDPIRHGSRRILWLGSRASRAPVPARRGRERVHAHAGAAALRLDLPAREAVWIEELIEAACLHPPGGTLRRYGDFPTLTEMLARWSADPAVRLRQLEGPTWHKLRAAGLLLI